MSKNIEILVKSRGQKYRAGPVGTDRYTGTDENRRTGTGATGTKNLPVRYRYCFKHENVSKSAKNLKKFFWKKTFSKKFRNFFWMFFSASIWLLINSGSPEMLKLYIYVLQNITLLILGENWFKMTKICCENVPKKSTGTG